MLLLDFWYILIIFVFSDFVIFFGYIFGIINTFGILWYFRFCCCFFGIFLHFSSIFLVYSIFLIFFENFWYFWCFLYFWPLLFFLNLFLYFWYFFLKIFSMAFFCFSFGILDICCYFLVFFKLFFNYWYFFCFWYSLIFFDILGFLGIFIFLVFLIYFLIFFIIFPQHTLKKNRQCKQCDFIKLLPIFCGPVYTIKYLKYQTYYNIWFCYLFDSFINVKLNIIIIHFNNIHCIGIAGVVRTVDKTYYELLKRFPRFCVFIDIVIIS